MDKSKLPKLTKEEVEALIKYISANVVEDDESDSFCSEDAFGGALYAVYRVIRKAYGDE